MGKFGWSLPPGCTMADIDRAFGDQPTMLEAFEVAEGNKLSEEEKKILSKLFNEFDCENEVIEKAMSWACKTGYDQCQGDEAEYQYYRSEQRQRRLPKIRAYFKGLRQRAGI